jgi:3-oxoacyl-ACP reductase-like protein
MSIFESIKNAIFGKHVTAASPASAQAAPAAQAAAPSAPPAATLSSAISASDLQAQLAALSAKSSQKLNWQTSIVDLMKLTGLDPSFANRKALAAELGYSGDTNDSASMNIWLHKAVMDKLAQSGGKVTDELRK